MTKSKKRKSPTQAALRVIALRNPQSDPQGSYTGVPQNRHEMPVQDADDL